VRMRFHPPSPLPPPFLPSLDMSCTQTHTHIYTHTLLSLSLPSPTPHISFIPWIDIYSYSFQLSNDWCGFHPSLCGIGLLPGRGELHCVHGTNAEILRSSERESSRNACICLYVSCDMKHGVVLYAIWISVLIITHSITPVLILICLIHYTVRC
jgi:hypothetical protein